MRSFIITRSKFFEKPLEDRHVFFIKPKEEFPCTNHVYFFRVGTKRTTFFRFHQKLGYFLERWETFLEVKNFGLRWNEHNGVNWNSQTDTVVRVVLLRLVLHLSVQANYMAVLRAYWIREPILSPEFMKERTKSTYHVYE